MLFTRSIIVDGISRHLQGPRHDKNDAVTEEGDALHYSCISKTAGLEVEWRLLTASRAVWESAVITRTLCAHSFV